MLCRKSQRSSYGNSQTLVDIYRPPTRYRPFIGNDRTTWWASFRMRVTFDNDEVHLSKKTNDRSQDTILTAWCETALAGGLTASNSDILRTRKAARNPKSWYWDSISIDIVGLHRIQGTLRDSAGIFRCMRATFEWTQ